MPLCDIKKEVRVVMFNATFNNISVISWQSVLLVEKTTDLPQVTYKLSHNVVSSAPYILNLNRDSIDTKFMYKVN
jgi:hypothetical protein